MSSLDGKWTVQVLFEPFMHRNMFSYWALGPSFWILTLVRAPTYSYLTLAFFGPCLLARAKARSTSSVVFCQVISSKGFRVVWQTTFEKNDVLKNDPTSHFKSQKNVSYLVRNVSLKYANHPLFAFLQTVNFWQSSLVKKNIFLRFKEFSAPPLHWIVERYAPFPGIGSGPWPL